MHKQDKFFEYHKRQQASGSSKDKTKVYILKKLN